MHKMLRDDSQNLNRGFAGAEIVSAPSPLFEVLWYRRWTLALTILACVASAGVYLALAEPVFSATARLQIVQNGPKVFSDAGTSVAQSESYLQTQAEFLGSAPVLARALETVDYRKLKTFASLSGDPITWLQRGNSIKIDVARKSDVVAVSMESPYPDEAAAFTNSLVQAYMVEQSRQTRATGSEIVRALQAEKASLQRKREACLAAMLKCKRTSGVLSFQLDRANTSLDRAVSLSTSLTQAEVATMELRAQQEAISKALANPTSIAAFVEAQQMKGRDAGDREYDELRTQLNDQKLALSTARAVQGPSNSRVQVLQRVIDSLVERIADKQRLMVESQLASISGQLAAAEDKERQLRTALSTQQDQVLNADPDAAEYAKLDAEATRLQKQLELVDNRMAEVNVNSIEVAPLNVQILEPARVQAKPVRPKKAFTLAAALMVGWVLGIGMALMREWRDARLRTPEEIPSLLGTPVIAMVPRMNTRLSPVTRGQVVRLDARSPVAEAYRSVRTSLHLGTAGRAKTILLASPAPGDGKSMTASNLAIAFAQAGERTLLLDCDLRQPVQHMVMEVNGDVGLSSVMNREATLRDAIVATSVPNLHVLPCGPIPENPSELLDSKHFAKLMQTLSAAFDRIIIDSPPLISVTDARILASSADVTLLVLRMNKSMRALGTLALDGLEKVGANVIGAIANDVPSSKAYHYYGGSWQYATNARLLPPLGAGLSADQAQPGASGEGGEMLVIEEPDWAAKPQEA